jgi:multimeric flavodoxin WrbA
VKRERNLGKGEKFMKAIAFNGSGRKNGNTVLLLNTVLAELTKEGRIRIRNVPSQQTVSMGIWRR